MIGSTEVISKIPKKWSCFQKYSIGHNFKISFQPKNEEKYKLFYESFDPLKKLWLFYLKQPWQYIYNNKVWSLIHTATATSSSIQSVVATADTTTKLTTVHFQLVMRHILRKNNEIIHYVNYIHIIIDTDKPIIQK